MLLIPALTTSGPTFNVHGWTADIIIVAAVCGAIYSILRMIGVFYRGSNKGFVWFRGVNSNAELAPELKRVAELAPLVEEIHAEFHTNGGKSMRDAMNENTQITKENAEALKQLAKDVETLKRITSKHSQQLKDLHLEEN